MKIHSWKTLLVTIVVGGGFFSYRILHFGGLADLIWLGLFAYLIIQGLHVSFSKDAYDEDNKRAEKGKRVYRKLFGRFGLFVPYTPFVFILLSWAVSMLLPTWKWLMIILLISALASAVWILIIYKKHMRVEED